MYYFILHIIHKDEKSSTIRKRGSTKAWLKNFFFFNARINEDFYDHR